MLSGQKSLPCALTLKGYDLVSYFQKDQPIKGTKEFQLCFEGSLYRFSSQRNLETFEANPQDYLPQYDGWCAYGIAVSSKKYRVNPRAYEIVDGKL